MEQRRRCSRTVLYGLVFLYSSLVGDASPVRGVAPSDAFRYEGTTFSCWDGQGLELAGTAVNDNFCDCADGTDEPGTGACAGVGKETAQPWFYCPNNGGAPRYLYASRVGDGVCDCCDGSDEWQHGWCKDRCEDEGQHLRQQLEQMKVSMERGIEKRNRAIADMREKAESSKARLAELRHALPGIQDTEMARKHELDQAEIEFKKHAEEQAGQDIDVVSSEGTKVSEYAKWMEKDDASDAAVDAEDEGGILHIAKERKTLEHIEVKSGDLVDFVEFFYTSGERLLTGAGEGNPQDPFYLQPGEAIVEIRGGQGGLLDSVQFVTDKGRESQVFGGSGGGQYSVKAKPGMQIIGLQRGEGIAGAIKGVFECDYVDRRSAEEISRDMVRDTYKLAQRELQKAQAEVRDLEATLEGDFTDSQAAYNLFSEKCGKTRIEQYEYEICLFGDAKQDYTTLGRWKGWEQKATHVAVFENGDSCFSGRKRSLRLAVQCGEHIEIRNVKEPSQCSYEASMTHPGACDPKAVEAGANTRVIMPNENHDEL